VILGSLPFRDPDATHRLLAEYGADRIVVSLDHAGGRIKVAGWTSDAGATVAEALERFRTLEARLFLVTCIDRDGTLTGPDTDTVRRISSYTRVISAGGVSELGHLRELSGAGAEAAVVGKALYEGCFTLREAKEASL
jgi:phosphoribosylformimino-5-aminoimidazole carboxamide ribonucleotide (ProFAR) isomerase